MIRFPSVTRRTDVVSAGAIVTAETARNWVGGDTSHDSMLADMILMAQEEVEAYMGIGLGSTTITDLYAAWCVGDRLIASAPHASDPAVTLLNLSGTRITLATPADYVTDTTGERPAVLPQTARLTWEHARNPVSVEYDTSATDNPRIRERIQNAILTRVGILFESRGTVPPAGWERAWQSTLPRVFK